MPVIVERLAGSELSEADRNDLLRIYADAPDWLLPSGLTAQSLVQGRGHQWLAARFNGRLLGAALLLRTPGHWGLGLLCVRQITRQRGVARRLIDQAGQAAREDRASLYLASAETPAEARDLASHLQLELRTLPAALD